MIDTRRSQARDMLNRRYDDPESGKVKAVTADEVLARLWAKSAGLPSKPRWKGVTFTPKPGDTEFRYNLAMGRQVIHIPEADATSDFASVLAQVETGAEIIIERDHRPLAVVNAAAPERRTISECIARLPEHSVAVIDADFARDVEAAVAAHREPLNPPQWD